MVEKNSEGMFTKEEIEEQCTLEWRRKSQKKRPHTCEHPDWLVLSKSISPSAEHVNMIMCKACFHIINLGELYKHREA